MALAQSFDSGPGQRPNLNSDEQRIANAVVVALESRFAKFEERMGKRFEDHMTEIESYYAVRDQERDQLMKAIKQDLETILSRPGGKSQ